MMWMMLDSAWLALRDIWVFESVLIACNLTWALVVGDL